MKKWPKPGHQVSGSRRVAIHYRHSKLGKVFQAGSLPPRPKFEEKKWVIGALGRLKGKTPKLMKAEKIVVLRPLRETNAGRMGYIKRLTRAMKNGQTSPIKVIKVQGKTVLWDGRHRLRAAHALGYKKVWVQQVKPAPQKMAALDRYLAKHPMRQVYDRFQKYLGTLRGGNPNESPFFKKAVQAYAKVGVRKVHRPGLSYIWKKYPVSKRAQALIRAGKLPPAPKVATTTYPRRIKVLGFPKVQSLAKLHYRMSGKIKADKEWYLAGMRKSLKKGTLPPPEVVLKRGRATLWDGRHRTTAIKQLGYTHTWVTPVTRKRSK